jgi:hypothetical protein
MFKLFTLQEANRLIPVVDRTLRELQSAISDLADVKRALERAKPLSVEGKNLGEELTFLLRSIHEHKAELDRLGVHVKDIQSGQVDFPAQLGAEVVCLAWAQGQEAITHYHRLNETAPRPLAMATPHEVRASL